MYARLILVLIISQSVSATTYELKDTSARFFLKIDKSGVSYSSEALTKKIDLKKCNDKLLRSFSEQFFRALPGKSESSGLSLYVNGKVLQLKPSSKEAQRLMAMDAEILALELQHNKVCK
jgi:hypothetical protein